MAEVRIIELQPCTVVTSGTCTDLDCFAPDGLLASFNAWWSELDDRRADSFFPRDFMSYDDELKGLVWWYAIPEQLADTGGWERVRFEGGLYAAAVCRDGDDADSARVSARIRQWIEASEALELDESRGHGELFHSITPPAVAQALGYGQLELFVPVRLSS